jgi:ABC-2 type transport system permease protein
MGSQARAIVWAQWRTLWNYFPRSNRAAFVFSGLLWLFWYGAFAWLAATAAWLFSQPEEIGLIRRILPGGLLLCFLYWQAIPLLLVSTGMSLDFKKLTVYPIPTGQLFGLEVLLRVTTGMEMILLLLGASAGLLLNPKMPSWTADALIVFGLFNLLLSAGVRDLLSRLLARKRVRELTAFLFVLAAALPQLLLMRGGGRITKFLSHESWSLWPWSAAATLAGGEFSASATGVLLAWTAAAWIFGRWQFARGLRFDGAEGPTKRKEKRAASRLDFVFRLPGRLLRDPLAAVVEKELRFLSRSPRFRLVFLMGFSFGLLIWIPAAFNGSQSGDSFLATHYLALVSLYALLLLSDALFWNAFGFDRAAAQSWFLFPVKISTVLRGKNTAAFLFVLVEIAAIGTVCVLLRFPVALSGMLEALGVVVVATLFLLAIGNLSSTYTPRGVDPSSSFRQSSGASGSRAVLMFVFPVAMFPVMLAYGARYAFVSDTAFYGVLVFMALVGAAAYKISMDSAVAAAEARKERILAALSVGEGPMSA